jgi:hypothetical protein
VELRDRHDRPPHRAGRHQAFLLALAGVVGVALDLVDPDDREQHVVPHARLLLRGEQVAGGGAEVRHDLALVGGRAVGGVDDGLDAGQRTVEAVAGGQVHAE